MNYIAFNSLLSSRYFYADTPNYSADSLFCRHKIPVKFSEEYVKKDEKYILVSCKVRRKYRAAFKTAMEELSDKMALIGHSDYDEFCEKLFSKLKKEAGRADP